MTKPRVLISDALSDAALRIFEDRGVHVDFKPGIDKDELVKLIPGYDGLAIRSATKVTAKLLDAATRLKVVGRAGIGVDNVDIPAATSKGVIVMNTPFGNSITTAEHAIALMFALARQIPQADASTQAGKWEKNRFMGVELSGKVVGIIGCGNIGSVVAERAIGLKMRVIAFDPFLSPERALAIGVEKVELDDLLERADIISLHTPMTAQTKNILSRGKPRQNQKGRAHRQLRARRASRREGFARSARSGPCRRRRDRCLRRGAGEDRTLSSAIRMSCARLISEPRRRRRRRMWLCRSPSRCRTICCAGRSPTPSTFRRSRPRKRPSSGPMSRLRRSSAPSPASSPKAACKAVHVTYSGEVAGMKTKALTSAAVAGLLAADARRHQRGLGAERRQGARHHRRGDHARGRPAITPR